MTRSTSLPRRNWLRLGLTTGAAVAAQRPARLLAGETTSVAAPAISAPVRLSLNENPFGPSERAVRAIAEHLGGGLSRYVEAEATAFTAQAATREGLPAEQIVLGETLEPLGTLLALDGGPGGEIVYSVPGYTALVDAAARVGGAGAPVPLDARLENDLPAIAARVNGRTRAVFLVNPHNPSGTVSAPLAWLAFLRELSRRTLVIVDEAYLDFDEQLAPLTAARLTREGANIAVFRTFSKLHGLAALPFGYAAVPRALGQRLRALGIGEPRTLNALALRAAAASLDDPAYAATTRAKVATERALWFRALDRLGLRRTAARGNFVFFETRRPHDAVASAFLAHGVKIGRAFPPLDTWARISIGLPEENTLARAALSAIF